MLNEIELAAYVDRLEADRDPDVAASYIMDGNLSARDADLVNIECRRRGLPVLVEPWSDETLNEIAPDDPNQSPLRAARIVPTMAPAASQNCVHSRARNWLLVISPAHFTAH